MSVQFPFGDYSFDLVELVAELEPPELAAWASVAVLDGRFRSLLLAEAAPLLDEETADDPLDLMGEAASSLLKTALAALYERRTELPGAFAVELAEIESPGPRLRTSELSERRSGPELG